MLLVPEVSPEPFSYGFCLKKLKLKFWILKFGSDSPALRKRTYQQEKDGESSETTPLKSRQEKSETAHFRGKHVVFPLVFMQPVFFYIYLLIELTSTCQELFIH